MFKVGVVPVMDGPATVYIPRTLTASFIQYEDTIARSYVPDVSTPAPVTYASVTKGSSKSYTHVVRSGESLGLIAQRNSVSIQDLRRWNHLHGDRIRAGQRLLLHHEVVPEPVTTTKEPDEAKAVPASPGATEYIYHTCLLYTSDAADERSSVDLGGRRIIKKKQIDNISGIGENKKEIYKTR
mgnify:CR=1 FL=1